MSVFLSRLHRRLFLAALLALALSASGGLTAARSAPSVLTDVSPSALLTPQPQDAPNGPYPGYLTYPEIQAKIAGWLHDYPALVQVRSLGKTFEGREIPLVRLSAAPDGPSGPPEVLFVAGTHPREQQPPIGLTRLGDELLAGYGKDARLTRLLKERVVWLVPMFNVDGKIYDLEHGNGTTRGADWRKNRHPNADGSIGVDLNRNFGVQWGGDHSLNPTWRTTTDTPDTNIYEGPAPFSEPETQDLSRFIASRRGRLRGFLDLHSPLHFLHGPSYLSTAEGDRYQTLLDRMEAAQKDPYPINKIYRDTDTPLTERSGDTGLTFTWAYYTQGVYGFNMEYAPPPGRATGVLARYAPPAQIVEEGTRDIDGPLLALIDAAGSLPSTVTGHVTMAAGPGTLSAPLTPGATSLWTAPVLTGDWSYAILVSEGGQIDVLSEFRNAPLQNGFTIRAQKNAVPGAVVPMTLYVWDKNHSVSAEHFTLTIQGH